VQLACRIVQIAKPSLAPVYYVLHVDPDTLMTLHQKLVLDVLLDAKFVKLIKYMYAKVAEMDLNQY